MKAITTRQFEIIESAGKILTESGVGGLTIKRLAAEMGFSEAALYRHFENKKSILITMLRFLANNMDDRLSNVDKNITGANRFKALFNSQIDFFNANPHFVVVVFSDGLLEESHEINQEVHKIMQIKMKHLMPVIHEGQEMGVFTKELTAQELVHIIMGSFRLQMYNWRVSNFELDLSESVNKLINSLLIILKNKTS